jgi:hypothetical protein
MLLKSAGLLAAALALGCGCGDDAPPVDGDLGVDAGVDGGQDLGIDGGPADAGPIDGGPSDPGWVRLPDLPLGCRIERAQFPERIFSPQWQSCGEGCRFLDSDPAFEMTPLGLGSGPDRRTPGAPSFVFVKLEDQRDLNAPTIISLVGTDGSVAAAWGLPEPLPAPSCSISSTAHRDGWVGFTIWSYSETSEIEYQSIFHGPVEEMKDADRPVLVLGPDDLPGSWNSLQRAYVSPEAVAFQVQPLGEAWLIRDGVRRRLGVAGFPAGGDVQRMALIGDHLLWNEWGATDVRISHGSFEQESAEYYYVEGTSALFDTDGSDLAWVLGYDWDGSAYSRKELWVADYVPDPAGLSPRLLLADYQGSTQGLVGGSAWMTLVERDGRRGFEMVDLDDGERTMIWAPADTILTHQPSWITANDIGAVARRTAGRSFYTFLIVDRELAEPVE